MRTRILSEDVFLIRTIEKKEEKKVSDYKNLYGDQHIHKEYIKEPGNEADQKNQPVKNKQIRKQFQQQFNTLLTTLEKWGAENKCEFQAHVPELRERFFQQYWSGMHEDKWFQNYKANLETIWFQTQRSELRDIDKEAINFMLLDAFSSSTCSIGSGNDIATLTDILNNEISLPRWLSRFCNEIVDNFAAKHIAQFDIREGIRNHVYLACRQVVRDNGWPCSYDTSGTNDPYAVETELTSEHLNSLLKIVQETFAPKNILARILKDFKNELQKLYPLGDVKWVCYDKRRATQIEFIFKQLELDIKLINVFDLSEDATCIRLNEFKFKLNVLRALHLKRKLFNSEKWKRVRLKGGAILWALDVDPQAELFYLSDKENGLDIPLEKLLRLCQSVTPVKHQLKLLMAQLVDENLELVKALKEKNDKFFIEIISAGYPLSRKNKENQTPLTLASGNASWNLLEQLLDIYQGKELPESVRLTPKEVLLPNVLLDAIDAKQWQLVDRLLQFKINLNQMKFTDRGYSALHCAIHYNNFPLVQLLLTRGADCNAQSAEAKYNHTPLMVAAIGTQVQLEILDLLLDLPDINLNKKAKSGHTALTLAAHTGQIEKVKKIIFKCRARKSKTLGEQLGVALYGAVRGEHLAVIELLLLAGAPMDGLYRLEDNKTVLDGFVALGKWDMFSYLIKNGYSLAAKNKDNRTPIQIAATNQKWNIVKAILKEYPADEKDVAHYGACLLSAVQTSQWEIIEQLLKFNDALDWQSHDDGYTVFHYSILRNQINAESKDKPSFAQRLLDAGANVNFIAKSPGKVTPLQMAACKSEVEVKTFLWLLERKNIKIDGIDKDGNTALMMAVEAGCLEKVAMLLEHKADFSQKRLDDKAALDIALEKKNEKITELLISRNIGLIKEKIDCEDYSKAASLLILIHSHDQAAFFKALSDLKPHLESILINETTCYDELLRICITLAIDAKKLDAIKSILEVAAAPEFFFFVLGMFLKSNDREGAEVLLANYKECNTHSLKSFHPFMVVCSKEVSLETFKWLLSHPKFRQELNSSRDVYAEICSRLIKQNDVHKMAAILYLKELQWFLATDEMMEYEIDSNSALKEYVEKVERNKDILSMLIRISKKDFSDPFDASPVAFKGIVNILLDRMPGSNAHKNRIRFILGEFCDEPVELKMDSRAEFNFDWYNQAFLFAHCASEDAKYESRQRRIRERAFAAFQQYIAKLDVPAQKIALIKRAKAQPIFCKSVQFFFGFYRSPDVLRKLDDMVKPAPAKFISRFKF